ncbi:hypothetical protein TWF281_000612 [Arthrobotrys megalospora]
MHSQRTTRSHNRNPTNVNKPFKPHVISKPAKEVPQIFKGVLDDDDIEDSDLDKDSSLDEIPVVDLSTSPQKVPTSTPPKPRSKFMVPSTPEPDMTTQTPPKDDEIEEVEEEKISRRTAVPGKRGKFNTRKDKEKFQYFEQKKTEREATTAAQTKQKALKMPGCREALLESVEKYDPVKIADASPRKSPEKSPEKGVMGRERYNSVLKKHGLELDPKLQSLLDDRFDTEEPSFDFGSDSDSSVSSSSSKKRKRGTSDSEGTPKKAEESKLARQTKKPRKYLCPMCNEEVSQQLYESYLPDLEKRFKLDLRRKFHKSHKLEKVHAKVKELNIPEIDWDNLEDRCTKYFPYLSDIMARKTKSHFRDLSEKFNKTKRKNNKSRTEALFDDGDWEKTYPGYYGPRGSEIMGDAISSSKAMMGALKKLGKAKDITTMGGGAGSYIQCILIPELATRLIMEDFGMSDDEIDKGRQLMQETINIGLLLNDDNNADNEDATGVNDGMDWWWKEQEAKRLQEEETEPSQSQTSIYVGDSDDE